MNLRIYSSHPVLCSMFYVSLSLSLVLCLSLSLSPCSVLGVHVHFALPSDHLQGGLRLYFFHSYSSLLIPLLLLSLHFASASEMCVK